MKIIEKDISGIQNQVRIQGENGNWNYSPYMMGLFNGLELALSALENREPNFKSSPKEWLENRQVCTKAEICFFPICPNPEPQQLEMNLL